MFPMLCNFVLPSVIPSVICEFPLWNVSFWLLWIRFSVRCCIVAGRGSMDWLLWVCVMYGVKRNSSRISPFIWCYMVKTYAFYGSSHLPEFAVVDNVELSYKEHMAIFFLIGILNSFCCAMKSMWFNLVASQLQAIAGKLQHLIYLLAFGMKGNLRSLSPQVVNLDSWRMISSICLHWSVMQISSSTRGTVMLFRERTIFFLCLICK